MNINTKCNKCNEPTKSVTGFWDGKGGTHGCLYDCKNAKCEVKRLKEATEQETMQNRAEVQYLNGKNGIYAGQLAAVRRGAKVSARKMAEIAGCNVAEYCAYEKERKVFNLAVYQKCMNYLKPLTNIGKGVTVNDFLGFFNKIVADYPMHLEIGYNEAADWGIYIYKRGCGENGKDLVIANVWDCDMELCFARAQVQLKEWLSENEGGY